MRLFARFGFEGSYGLRGELGENLAGSLLRRVEAALDVFSGFAGDDSLVPPLTIDVEVLLSALG